MLESWDFIGQRVGLERTASQVGNGEEVVIGLLSSSASPSVQQPHDRGPHFMQLRSCSV